MCIAEPSHITRPSNQAGSSIAIRICLPCAFQRDLILRNLAALLHGCCLGGGIGPYFVRWLRRQPWINRLRTVD